MSNWALSTIELHDCAARNGTTASRPRQLLQLAWQTFTARCQQLGELFKRESNKPLPKELRRSLRLNKSARRKGYQEYESATDKRRRKEYLNQPVNISIRLGPAFDYRPSNC
ncbi:CG18577 [Drosophila busckii]|uniref:CG18577 n=1 Tax=Drosophila busckii TaxID=30019 RepID=A0A0M3QXC5_DROBS|nr:CG18577 [Drosophila busckii]